MSRTDSNAASPDAPPAAARRLSPGRAEAALTLREVLLYRWLDNGSGVLIGAATVFAPWAFGTTQPWAIRGMNGVGYLLGALLLAKFAIRRLRGYAPPRWDGDGGAGPALKRLHVALAVFTALILAYCLIAALNTRAMFNPQTVTLTYFRHLPWLPHSYDGPATWQALANYLALALGFWATRDWLLGKTLAEDRAARQVGLTLEPASALPTRLRWLLGLLVVNASLVSLEGFAQRLAGSNKLLFLRVPPANPYPETQWGPFAYRSNACQYFNLVWPVGLALWWTSRQIQAQRRRWRSFRWHWRYGILLSVGALVAAPVVTQSRAGALAAMVMLALAVLLILFSLGREAWPTKLGLLLVLALGLGVSFKLGGPQIKARFAEVQGGVGAREQLTQTGLRMFRAHPVFGVGPGALGNLYLYFRATPTEPWPRQLHNDWVETLATFGLVGSPLVLGALALVLARGFLPGNLCPGRRFILLLWLALAGCLAQGLVDFPLQLYSVQHLFLLLCAVLLVSGRLPGAHAQS